MNNVGGFVAGCIKSFATTGRLSAGITSKCWLRRRSRITDPSCRRTEARLSRALSIDVSGSLDADLLRNSRDAIPDLNLKSRLQLFGRSPGQSGGTYAADNGRVVETADAGVCELVLGNV